MDLAMVLSSTLLAFSETLMMEDLSCAFAVTVGQGGRMHLFSIEDLDGSYGSCVRARKKGSGSGALRAKQKLLENHSNGC